MASSGEGDRGLETGGGVQLSLSTFQRHMPYESVTRCTHYLKAINKEFLWDGIPHALIHLC